MKNLDFPASPLKLSKERLKELLLHHFRPVNFVSSERVKFSALVHTKGQSVRGFVLGLQAYESTGDYGPQLDDQL